jgi:uncharacterized protein YciI
MDFDTNFLAFLLRGPTWTPAETPELVRLQAAHVAHLTRRTDSGQLVLNGPCTDGGNLRGVSVYKVASQAEAQALANEDPMVDAGRLVIEFHPWMVPAGSRLP